MSRGSGGRRCAFCCCAGCCAATTEASSKPAITNAFISAPEGSGGDCSAGAPLGKAPDPLLLCSVCLGPLHVVVIVLDELADAFPRLARARPRILDSTTEAHVVAKELFTLRIGP